MPPSKYLRLCPDIPERDYEAFKSALAEDTALPETFGEWIAIQRAREQEALGLNKTPTEWVAVDFDRFKRYCDAVGLKPSLGALVSLCAALITSETQH